MRKIQQQIDSSKRKVAEKTHRENAFENIEFFFVVVVFSWAQ